MPGTAHCRRMSVRRPSGLRSPSPARPPPPARCSPAGPAPLLCGHASRMSAAPSAPHRSGSHPRISPTSSVSRSGNPRAPPSFHNPDRQRPTSLRSGFRANHPPCGRTIPGATLPEPSPATCGCRPHPASPSAPSGAPLRSAPRNPASFRSPDQPRDSPRWHTAIPLTPSGAERRTAEPEADR